MQTKIMMGMYSGPDKNQATIPATTFKSMFTDAKIENFVYKPVSRWSWPTRPRPRSTACWAASTTSTPRTRGRSAIWDTREDQRIVENIALGIQMFLGIIGALTLFVGGMGVANIMYAVVKERTREIGVKMALGAKMRQVMAPFVLEALLMTVIGRHPRHRRSSLGPDGRDRRAAAQGRGLRLPGPAHLLAGHRAPPPRSSWARSAPLAGYFPARRAASVNPAVSLRYE